MRFAVKLGSAFGLIASGLAFTSSHQFQKKRVQMDEKDSTNVNPPIAINANIPIGLPQPQIQSQQQNQQHQFKVRKDDHRGIHISTQGTKYDTVFSFSSELNAVLSDSSNNKIASVWVHLTQDNLHLSNWLVENGFEIHHSESNNSLMFNKWMDPNRPNKIPHFSTHYLSCASILISADNQILIEKNHGKWGVPVDTTQVSHTADKVARNSLARALSTESPFDYHSVLLMREITKTKSGYPDILVAMQFSTNQKAEECITQPNAKWLPLDEVPNFLKESGSNIHYPLHYLILERVWTLHQQNLLREAHHPIHSYQFKGYNINSSIYPLL